MNKETQEEQQRVPLVVSATLPKSEHAMWNEIVDFYTGDAPMPYPTARILRGLIHQEYGRVVEEREKRSNNS